ncbi:MAG: hypothetical protein KF791_08515 [Verrucomicrobiae bacterium]|nr:hypothetical protein [Verrucomicrobiae bacterium]
MTPKQTQLYWREWAAVRRADPSADRHEIQARAIGCTRSSKLLTNRDLDLVLGAFRAISDPGSLGPQLRAQNQVRARLEHRLAEITQCLGVYVEDPAGYVARVVSDRRPPSPGGTVGVDDLSHEPRLIRRRASGELLEIPSELLQLVMTLWARLQAMRNARHHSLADMYSAAGIPPERWAKKRTSAAHSPKVRGRGQHGADAPAMALAGDARPPGPGEDPF